MLLSLDCVTPVSDAIDDAWVLLLQEPEPRTNWEKSERQLELQVFEYMEQDLAQMLAVLDIHLDLLITYTLGVHIG